MQALALTLALSHAKGAGEGIFESMSLGIVAPSSYKRFPFLNEE
jgi:hypothetical protein